MEEAVEQSFNKQQVEEIMNSSIASVLKNREFSADKLHEWLSQILEDVLRRLSVLGPKFKYCATGVIEQNCGAGLHISNCGRFEKNTDSFGSVKYQQGSILCALVVYGFRI